MSIGGTRANTSKPITEGDIRVTYAKFDGNYTYTTMKSSRYCYDSSRGWYPSKEDGTEDPTQTIYLPASDALITVCYPYEEYVTNEQGTALEGYVPLRAGRYDGTPTKHDSKDVCYNSVSTMNATNPSLAIELKHEMALLNFHLTNKTYEELKFSKITISSNVYYTFGGKLYMTASTGYCVCHGSAQAFHSFPAAEESGISWFPNTESDPMIIPEEMDSKVSTSGLLTPLPLDLTPLTGDDHIICTFTINGKDKSVNIPLSSFGTNQRPEANKSYDLYFNLNSSSTPVELTGVNVLPWRDVTVSDVPEATVKDYIEFTTDNNGTIQFAPVTWCMTPPPARTA